MITDLIAKLEKEALEKPAIEQAEKQHTQKALKKFADMSDKELKAELKERDLSTKGDRDDYMERLTEVAKKDAKKAVKKQQKALEAQGTSLGTELAAAQKAEKKLVDKALAKFSEMSDKTCFCP